MNRLYLAVYLAILPSLYYAANSKSVVSSICLVYNISAAKSNVVDYTKLTRGFGVGKMLSIQGFLKRHAKRFLFHITNVHPRSSFMLRLKLKKNIMVLKIKIGKERIQIERKYTTGLYNLNKLFKIEVRREEEAFLVNVGDSKAVHFPLQQKHLHHLSSVEAEFKIQGHVKIHTVCYNDVSVTLQTTSSPATTCPNGQILNYFYKNHQPTFCVINKPRLPDYNGKCIDMWDLYNRSNILKGRQITEVYCNKTHIFPHLFHFLDYSTDEADKTPSGIEIKRIQTGRGFLGPHSFCKKFVDNSFLSFLSHDYVEDCPNNEMDIPSCTERKLEIPDGINYGVKFEDGILAKCELRMLQCFGISHKKECEPKCLKLKKAIEMLENFSTEEEFFFEESMLESKYVQEMYSGQINNGFMDMIKNGDSIVGAMGKLNKTLGYKEDNFIEGSISGEHFKIGAVTFCTIVSDHLPYPKEIEALVEACEYDYNAKK